MQTTTDQHYSRIGVVSLHNEASDIDHFETYLSIFRPDIPEFTFDVFSIDGGTNSQSVTPSSLAEVFTQLTAGLASKVPMTLIAVGTETSDGPVRTFSNLTGRVVSD